MQSKWVELAEILEGEIQVAQVNVHDNQGLKERF